MLATHYVYYLMEVADRPRRLRRVTFYYGDVAYSERKVFKYAGGDGVSNAKLLQMAIDEFKKFASEENLKGTIAFFPAKPGL